jgi:hypothetical protein
VRARESDAVEAELAVVVEEEETGPSTTGERRATRTDNAHRDPFVNVHLVKKGDFWGCDREGHRGFRVESPYELSKS